METKGTGLRGKGHVVVGTIGADTHVIGARVIKYALEQAGFEVSFLGAFVSQEEFVTAAIETNADAIFVSSIYGQAELDCPGLREKCVEAGLSKILIYLGGNIAVENKPAEWDLLETKFKSMGFDRVYPPNTMPSRAISDLEKDLSIGHAC